MAGAQTTPAKGFMATSFMKFMNKTIVAFCGVLEYLVRILVKTFRIKMGLFVKHGLGLNGSNLKCFLQFARCIYRLLSFLCACISSRAYVQILCCD